MTKTTAAVVAFLLAGTAACGIGDVTDAMSSQPDVGEALAERADMLSMVTSYDTLSDLVPDEAPAMTMSAASTTTGPDDTAVVVGTVTGVDGLFGHDWPDEGGADVEPLPIQVAFDDPAADTLLVDITIAVEEQLGTSEPPPATIDIGLAIPAGYDETAIEDYLTGLGRSVFFLDSGSQVFAFDPSLYRILEEGVLIATVASDDTLAIPLVDDARETALLDGTPTLTALRSS